MLVERLHPARSAFNGFKGSSKLSISHLHSVDVLKTVFFNPPVIVVYNEHIIHNDYLQ